MLRSLTDKTIKYDIFMDLNYRMTKPRILKIICETESVGAFACGICCDQCGCNQGLLKDLGVTLEKPYFTNPVDPKRVCHALLDWLHGEKNLRSNMMDHALILPNGLHASKEDFEDLLTVVGSTEISSGHSI